jgi:hypothetical protein
MGKAFNYGGNTLEERFWSKVKRLPQDGCWEWQASLDTRGYGNFGMPRNDGTGRFLMKRAHRIAYELETGSSLDSTQHLCHTCDNRKCVRPSHLFVGNPKLNMADCSAKGRLGDRSGENNPRSKLTAEDVKAIRDSKLPLSKLVAKYGLAQSTLAYARQGKTWRGI